MAKAKFYSGTEAKINAKAIEDGVFYVSTDTSKLFVDIGGKRNNLTGELVTWSALAGKPSTFPPSVHTHSYAGSSSVGGSATSAVKLDTTSAGSTSQPIYFKEGKPSPIGYTINTSVPSNAKFTDTTYSDMTGSTGSGPGKSGLVPAPEAGKQTSFLMGNGTWAIPPNTTYGIATSSINGLMSTTMVSKLNSIDNNANNYSLPVATSSVIGGVKSGGDIVIDSAGSMNVTDNSHNHTIANITSLQSSLDAKLNTNLKGSANGLAELDSSGKVPSTQLPSYVDDVLEYTALANFPSSGETGKIYVDTTTNRTYRWSGSAYVEISASLALGVTSSTAYRGDYGNIAYAHSQKKGSGTVSDANPHGLTPSNIGAASTDVATTAANGLMASAMVTKLNGIATGANNYTLPTATTSVLGGVRTGSNITNSSGTISLTKANVVSALGYTPPTTDTNTTYSDMVGATTSAAGTRGLVPAPVAGAATRYLRSDGSWTVPPDTNTTYKLATTSVNGLMSAAMVSKLDGIDTGANNYSLPTASSTLGGVKTTSTVTSTSGLTACPIISGIPYYKDTNTTYTLGSFGITATAAQLNFCTGVTSNIQTQLDGKAASSHTHSYLPLTGGTLSGRLAANGKISAPTTAGGWITGATVTNATIGISTQQTTNSYHPVIACKTSGDHTWNLGGLGDSFGFYGFKSGRTENATDWSFTINASTGTINSTGEITAPTFSGSLSGNASTATALTTSAGSATNPVYFSGGKPVSCTYTLRKSVPSNAVFTDTDTTYSAASDGGLSLSSTAFSIADNGVTNAKIAANAVTMAKLGSDVGAVAVQSATPTDSHVKLWIKI